MKILNYLPNEIKELKKPPEKLFYKGNLELLQRKKISIVGTRRPSQYTKNIIFELAKKLSNHGICIVSGAAMGVDSVAHRGAGTKNTIAVMGNSLDIKYPAVNRKLIEEIEIQGLCLSQFEPTFSARAWSFVLRNELVVALGEILIVGEADLNSGSLRSVEYALKQNKQIYISPHRIGESLGTQKLAQDGLAETIYDIDDFVEKLSSFKQETLKKDEFWEFCSTYPTYDEAVKRYKDKIFEAELNGEIMIENGIVRLA